MAWKVEFTDEFGRWWETLTNDQQERITSAVRVLEEVGPGLGRPLVDTLKGTRISNLKELRPPGGFIRVIFAFDPQRSAILLCGGDKRGEWSRWYKKAISKAESLYQEHLLELAKDEQLI